MAEDEVVKHTRKIYKIWHSKEHSLWHKLKEFFIEILIIVFAVTLSIWLHDRSEHNHQQAEVKEFLLGLKQDLTDDIKEITGDKKSYENTKTAFRYITNIKLRQHLNKDSVDKFSSYFYNITFLIPNNGRFEGFKSSGKIGIIENKMLQNDIMDLYQENIPSLVISTDIYNQRKTKFMDYLQKNVIRITDSTSNIATLLESNESQNMCVGLGSVTEIIESYDSCLNKMNKIIDEIDKYYNIKKPN